MPVSKKQKVGVSFSSNTKQHDEDKVVEKPHKSTPKKQPQSKTTTVSEKLTNDKKVENKLQSKLQKEIEKQQQSNCTKLHHCSFSSWLPKSVTSISYNNEKNLVAVGREDSSIDIFIKENQELILLKTLGGSKFDFPILSIEYLSSKLLLSTMENKFVIWDLNNYRIIQELNTIGTVKSSTFNKQLNLLAVCTGDSIVRLYSFDGEKLEYQSSFPTITDTKTNTIEWGLDQKSLIVGCTNQLVIFKLDSLRSVLNVTTDNIISLKPLSNNTVVCGFINGFISIIDINFGSIIQDFRNLHQPVRSIQVSKDYQQFFAAGDESIIVSYNKSTSTTTTDESVEKWAPCGQHRRDSHDIKSLFITDQYLISGGESTQIIFYDLKTFTSLKNNNYQRYNSYPLINTISCTTNNKSILLIEASRQQINLWSLGDSNEKQFDQSLDLPNGTPLKITDKTKKLLQFESKSSLNIENINLSNDGNWFSFSTRLETKLYSIGKKESGNLTIKKVELPNEISNCSISKFTLDSKSLILAKDLKNIYNYNLELNQFNQINKDDNDDDDDNNNNTPTINSIEIDNDNKNLVIIDSTNQIYISPINNNNNNNKNKQSNNIIKLPNINSIPIKLYFSNNSNLLYIGTINSIVVFDINQLKISSITKLNKAVKTITANPNNQDELLIWTNSNEQFKFIKKQNSIVKASSSFSNVIFAASQLNRNDLVILDLSFFDKVLPSLPDAIKLKKFGGH